MLKTTDIQGNLLSNHCAAKKVTVPLKLMTHNTLQKEQYHTHLRLNCLSSLALVNIHNFNVVPKQTWWDFYALQVHQMGNRLTAQLVLPMHI